MKRLWMAALLLSPFLSLADAEDDPPTGTRIAAVPGTQADVGSGEETTQSMLVVREIVPGRYAPIDGARVRCWTEDCRGGARGATLVAEAETDDQGLAVLAGEADHGHHWLIDAPGYCVVHEYCGFGRFDDDPVVLRPGRARTIRILDPFGRPLAGAQVEAVMGCGHSPAAREGETNEEGLVTLGPVEDECDLWIEAPGVRADDYYLPPAPTDGSIPTILTRSGRTARGVITDPDGKPIGNAVIRELDRFRGPYAVSVPTGEFELHGLSGKVPLAVYRRFGETPVFLVNDFSDDVPLRIVLDPKRPGAMGDGEPRHRLDVKLEEAGSLCPIRCVRMEDGFTVRATSNLWWNGFSLPPGTYRVVAGGEFAYQEPHQAIASVPPPPGSPVTIRMERQAGSFFAFSPREAYSMDAQVRIPGRTKKVEMRSPQAWLPREGSAVLVVWTPKPVVLELPEGEARTQTVVLPDPTRIRLRVADEAGRTLDPVIECEAALGPARRTEDGTWELATREEGEIEIGVEAEGYALEEVVLVLPAAEGLADLGTVVLEPAAEPVTREVRLLDGAGRPVEEPWLELGDAEEPAGVEDTEAAGVLELTIVRPGPAVATAPGFLPMPVTVGPEGPDEWRFPAGRIEVTVRDAGGEPLDAVVWLDGHRFDGEGKIVIRGVPEGRHHVLVGATGHGGEARVIRTTAKETRAFAVTL